MESNRKHIIINASPEDYGNISKLFYSIKTEYFGRHRRKDTLQDLFFADYVTYRLLIPLTAARYINIGYAEVSNAPDMPALTGDLWPDLINFHYCCDLPLNASNTCFLNKYVYHTSYNPEMLEQLLQEIFLRENKLKFIVVLECPDYRLYSGKDIRNYSCLTEFSTVFYPKCFSVLTCTNTQKLHVIMRDKLLPQIRYRKALPQDNDDIVNIVNQESPKLKEQLGEYYIAEELLSEESKSLLIAAEIDNITAGFLWLNESLDILALLENFNLQRFGNLLKFSVKERFKEKVLTFNTVQRRPIEKLFTTEAISNIYFCDSDLISVSNISLCSGRTGADLEKEKKITLNSFLKRWEKLEERLKSTTYYVKMHEQQLSFFYNIPPGDTDAFWDTRTNAFVVELFGLMTIYDCRRVFEFLLTAFAAYPDKDYCLLSISSAKQTTAGYLEILKYFIPVTFRPQFYVEQYLFITHRSAIYGDLGLYAVRPDDVDDILGLLRQDAGRAYPVARHAEASRLSTVASRFTFRALFLLESNSYEEAAPNQYDVDPIIEILDDIFENPMTVYKCFTIRCGDSTRPIDDNKVVGFVIMRPFVLRKFLQKNFHSLKSDEFQNFRHAEIVALKLHPFFHFKSDVIFRELARQTHYFYFYYFQSTDHYSNPNDLATNMEPLEPRRIKNLWFSYLGKSSEATQSSSHSASGGDNKKPVKDLDLLNDHFAVFKTNLRPTAYFGSVRNIAILGFTDICKAFLRLMIFNWHSLSQDTQSTINCVPELNITVICAPGVMEADHEHTFECKSCAEKTEEICWTDFSNSDAFVRDVCERMDVRTWIRFVSGKVKSIEGEKHMITMQSGCEVYYEILLLMCGTEYALPPTVFNFPQRPPNYCHFNNRFDKILFYHKLQALLISQPKDIRKSLIVYGSHLRAFEFVNFLLQHDIEGSDIHLVMPQSRDAQQLDQVWNISTEDSRVEEILIEMVQDLGVHTYELMNVSGFKLHKENTNLQEVSFKKYISNDEMTLECDMFISFYEVFLPQSLLDIFEEADIDMDDDFILVDEKYKTSVNNIFAMGNFIKHRTEPNHQYRFVDPQDAAEKIIDSLQLIASDEPTETKFCKPSYFQAQLPMDYLLIKVIIPKRYLANHLTNEYGFVLNTYNDGEFGRVRLNEWDMVEEIVIVTRRKRNYDFLKFFCGRHELLLNNLRSRWYLKNIINFVDFFQEPWTELLMHDDFESLRRTNKNLIIEVAKEVMKKDMSRDERRKLLYSQCQNLGITYEMEYAFSEFIRQHHEEFISDLALPDELTPRRSRQGSS